MSRAHRLITLLAGALILAAVGCDRSTHSPTQGEGEDLSRQVRAHIDEGARLYRRGDYGGARDAFTEALRLDPQNAAAYYNRGLARKALKEYAKAIADLDEAIRLNPRDAEAWNNRGLARFHRRDYKEALGDFDEAIRLDGTRPGPFSNRGVTHLELKEYRLALKDLNEAIRIDPRYAKAYFNRGMTWTARKDYERAAADFTEAIRLRPTYPRAYLQRGLVYQAGKEYGRAAADYEKALTVPGDETSARYQLAWLLATCPDAKTRDGRRAVELARQACENTEWKSPECLAVLAAASAEAGDFAAARRWQGKALESPEYARGTGGKGRRQLRRYEDGQPWREE
jgi:tetratricopeptide (TPR) repeat protein